MMQHRALVEVHSPMTLRLGIGEIIIIGPDADLGAYQLSGAGSGAAAIQALIRCMVGPREVLSLYTRSYLYEGKTNLAIKLYYLVGAG